MTRTCIGAALLAAAWLPAVAADFHVTATARGGGDGSAARPWTLAEALKATGRVKPGDTIQVHGGVYTGNFESRLEGAEGAPVTVRGRRGERATIDARGHAGIDVFGQWTVFRDLEITDTDPDRTRERPHGLFVRGPHTSLINLVVHDCGVGIGFWSECIAPAEVYGCIVYNNGWQGPPPDRGHGHAIYTQNREGVKVLADNIMFNQFGYGIHAYGSEKAFLKGFRMEGNAAFNNGSLSRARVMTPGILVGGGSPAERIEITGNYLYSDAASAVVLRLGWGTTDRDVTARGNYIAGGIRLGPWEKAVMEDNTVVEKHAGSGVKVFVRPNRYERGRAHVIVFNWERAAAVSADLSGVLSRGDRFEVFDAQDYWGKPVAAGRFEGKPVRLLMAARKPAAPVGAVPSPPVATGPVFDVFVVRRTNLPR